MTTLQKYSISEFERSTIILIVQTKLFSNLYLAFLNLTATKSFFRI